MIKSFKERMEALRQTHAYCVEQAKLEFVSGITRLMKHKGINNSTLAVKLNTSSAYVTKALRGDTNFTIDSMVKITRTLGGRIHIHVADSVADVHWFEKIQGGQPSQGEVRADLSAIDHPEKISNLSMILHEIDNEERKIYA